MVRGRAAVGKGRWRMCCAWRSGSCMRTISGGAEKSREIAKRALQMSLRKAHVDVWVLGRWCLRELKAYLLRESNKALAGGEDPEYPMIMMLKWLMVPPP